MIKTANLEGRLIRQTDSLISLINLSNIPSKIQDTDYDSLARTFPTGLAETEDKGLDSSSYDPKMGLHTPLESENFLFRGIRNHMLRRNLRGLTKLCEFIDKKEKELLGTSISDIQSFIKSSVIDSYHTFENSNSSDPNVVKMKQIKLASEVSARTALLKEAICAYKASLKSSVESNMGIVWSDLDDSWFVAKKVSAELNKYLYSIGEILRRISAIDGDSDSSTAANNFVLIKAITKASSISEIVKSCGSSSRSDSSVGKASSLNMEGVQVVITEGKKKTSRSTSGGVLIGSDAKSIQVKIPGATKASIESNISTQSGSSIEISSDVDSKNIVVSAGGFTLNFNRNQTSKLSVAPGAFLILRNQGGLVIPGTDYTISPSKYTDASGTQVPLSEPSRFFFEQVSAGKSTPADDGKFSKSAFSTTQSTYYEVTAGGKKIRTTLSEYIKNNGEYSVDGKKYKIKLSDAKPIGISDAKKRDR